MGPKKSFILGFVCVFVLGMMILPASPAAKKKAVRGRSLRGAPLLIAPTRVIERPVIIQPSVIAPPPTRETIVAKPSEIKRVPVEVKLFQYGLSGGYLAGMPSVITELRFFEPLGLPATSLRFGVGIAVGNDSNNARRKHVLALIDGIYHLNPLYTLGINSYLGAGVNYDVYTTGQVSGSVGGDIYFGVETGQVSTGQFFAEAGYGKIRTGFLPSNSGLTLLTGIRL